MCGIVGAVAQRDVASILIEGLKRLEYRGYDSAGIAIIDAKDQIKRHRALGKVRELQNLIQESPLPGSTGIAHTRWATHGKPSEVNAHPHISHNEIALVHNGIIENHEELKKILIADGYQFTSDTDTEIVAHLVHQQIQQGEDFLNAVKKTVKKLHGAYAIGFIRASEPGRIIAVRSGSPLVVGIGIGEHFLASDQMALSPVVNKFIYLEEGDIADITREKITFYDVNGKQVTRESKISNLKNATIEKGDFRHFMLKEIFDQPQAVSDILEGRITQEHVLVNSFGESAEIIFKKVKRVQIVACGTSYHAAIIGRYWLNQLAKLPCEVEIASEIRYREKVVEPDTLFVTLSQSGETADTLGALRAAKEQGYLSTLTICNVPESSLVRESDLVLMMRAGPEIGVASTKAFTNVLVGLMMLTVALGRFHGMTEKTEAHIVNELRSLPKRIEQVLVMDSDIKRLARWFMHKEHTLFIGRGTQTAVAMEGALKLKEISYIHAESYPAGELKHGPLALVDSKMPVIVLAPADDLLEKLKSNLQEVRAREGDIIVFADETAGLESSPSMQVLHMPHVSSLLAPFIYTIPLQLLAYHVAVIKGTDVDQPRNLAKSVTVE